MNIVARLKATRQFSKAIREGLRLWADLQAGNVDVLFELFPLLREKLQPIAAPPPQGGGGQGFDELKEMLQIALANQNKDGYLMQSVTPAPALPTGNLITSKQLSAPVFDDDDMPALVMTKAAGSSSVMNFFNMTKDVLGQ